MRVCLLAGGTGGALLAAGFDTVLTPGDLTVITNTGDDIELHGLHISPDTDSVLYRLGGLFNASTGWGVNEETFAAETMLQRYGVDTWFHLGDRDLATHLLRSDLLRRGLTLTEVTAELARRLGIASVIVPMSDEPVRTRFETDHGMVGLQDYFIRLGCEPVVRRIILDGLDEAHPSPAALAALATAELVVIGPSNPLISIDPILAVLRQPLPEARTVVVSPLVGGRALKGPTVEMMRAVGLQPTPAEIAAQYGQHARHFVLDKQDETHIDDVARLGYDVVALDTVMRDGDGAARLARDILSFMGAGAAR